MNELMNIKKILKEKTRQSSSPSFTFMNCILLCALDFVFRETSVYLFACSLYQCLVRVAYVWFTSSLVLFSGSSPGFRSMCVCFIMKKIKDALPHLPILNADKPQHRAIQN